MAEDNSRQVVVQIKRNPAKLEQETDVSNYAQLLAFPHCVHQNEFEEDLSSANL
jgi:hypothetical protein